MVRRRRYLPRTGSSRITVCSFVSGAPSRRAAVSQSFPSAEYSITNPSTFSRSQKMRTNANSCSWSKAKQSQWEGCPVSLAEDHLLPLSIRPPSAARDGENCSASTLSAVTSTPASRARFTISFPSPSPHGYADSCAPWPIVFGSSPLSSTAASTTTNANSNATKSPPCRPSFPVSSPSFSFRRFGP